MLLKVSRYMYFLTVLYRKVFPAANLTSTSKAYNKTLYVEPCLYDYLRLHALTRSSKNTKKEFPPDTIFF